ncbi:chemotaxis protein CheA [Limnohabitans sp. Rim47]|uniref:chemotaxis protein CheA n=1 Tax=Limnohabitans sp. Rim47 TaxID=1100721 RepID=UPI0002D6BD38|nr:chemotaxis protein CheA [Limnohabitans sp. Rim47]
MSDDFLETIWAQYAVETEEHIESIESLLVKADAESLNAEEVSGLFRAFHSLKGLSRVMELGALESVAHRCEDLLGMVREGTAALDKNTVDLLLRSLDAIKVLCEKAVAERADGEKPQALLQELERAFKMVSQGQALTVAPASTEPSPAPVAQASAQASQAPEQTTASQPADTSGPAPVRTEATKAADGTTDNRQVVFLRLISNGLPILERLANSIATKQDAPQILAVANDIRKPLSWMLKGSNSLGYAGLDTRIEEILAALPVSEEISQADGERMVDVIVAFLDDLKTLGETTGVDLGGESLAKVLARTLKENLLMHLGQVEELLQTLEKPVDAQDDEIANLLSQRFSRIHGYLSSLYPQSRTDVPLLLVDAFARAGRNQMGIYSEVITLCRDALLFIRDLLNTSGRHPLKQAPLKAADEQLHQRIRDYLWSHDDAGDTPVDTVRQFVAAMNIPVELSELLSPDNTRELMELIQDGSLAYLIKAHLESSEGIATAFLEWVHDKGRVITNRTLIEADLSWYEMLFISKAPRAAIEQDLRTIDQGSGHVILLGELGKDNHKPTAAKAAAAPAPVAAPTTGATAATATATAPSPAPKTPASSTAAKPVASAAAPVESAPSSEVASVKPAAPVATATAAAAPAPRAATPAAANASSNVIRVPGEMLDQFMNQIGEMVLVRGQLAHIIGDQRVREGLHRLRHGQEGQLKDPQNHLIDLQQVAESLDDQLRRLQETDALIQGALSRLQDSVMGLRVVPVELVFKRFPRMVRDLALAQGKQIRLELIGQEVKIDKAMVESLADPLLHMVRNSADHGVEKPEDRRQAGKPDEAVIRIQAEQQGSRIMIRVIDDGKGIDPERVRRKAIERGLVKEEESLQMSKEDILSYIFRPAFSTADVVTETSGRGVGMDVVRTSVMRLGGTIHLDSEVGRGTTFTMQMPLSAAVQEVLLVNTANQTMAIPGRYVAELVEVSPDEYQTVKGRTAILLRGNFLPIVRLEEVLGYPAAETQSHRYVVVLSDGQRTLGVSVQEFVGRQELFTKDIHPRLAALPGVGGASILGDGRVVLILDAAALYRLAENLQTPHHLPAN